MLEKYGAASSVDAGVPQTLRLFIVSSDPEKGQEDLQIKVDGFSANSFRQGQMLAATSSHWGGSLSAAFHPDGRNSSEIGLQYHH